MGVAPARTPLTLDELMTPVRRRLSALLRSEALERGDADAALVQLTEAAASALRVERASVWRFDEEKSRLVCLDLFEHTPKRHSAGVVLHAKDTPDYFAAMTTERSIAAHDARTDPRTREFAKGYLEPIGITSMLDAPVLLNGHLSGVVCHEHIGPKRTWEPWEELVAATFGDFVSIVLGAAERAEQARALRTYREKLEALVEERTAALKESEARFEMLFDAAPVALVMTRLDDGAVLAANPRATAMFAVPQREAVGQQGADFWADLSERAALRDRVKEVGTVDSFEARLKSKDGRVFWADIAARVVTHGGERALIFGVRDIGAQKEAEDRLKVLATTDALTGALNRRRVFELAGEELERAERYSRPLSMAMLDLDFFKTVNDRYGHQLGDQALHAVAQAVKKVVRRGDKLGRYGGEEFLLVMPETSLETATAALERVRRAVEALELRSSEERVPLAVSAGVVSRRGGDTLDELLRRADEALFAAKRGGRNRVVVG